MARPSVARTIDAPAARVWSLLTDVDEWPRWGPSIRSARLDHPGAGLGAGATGSVTVRGGLTLSFVVTEFTDRRSWAWSVAGVPATDHRVDTAGGATTRVRFGVPLLAAPYLGVCALALRRLEHLAVDGAAGAPTGA